MRLYSITGRLVNQNVKPFLIDWDKASRSKLQFKVKQFLRTYWSHHIVYEEFPVYGTRLKVDILNATTRIAVEVNGQQHSNFNKFFHGDSRNKYLKSIKRDWKKEEWLIKNDFKLIQIEYDEVDVLTPGFFLENFGLRL